MLSRAHVCSCEQTARNVHDQIEHIIHFMINFRACYIKSSTEFSFKSIPAGYQTANFIARFKLVSISS